MSGDIRSVRLVAVLIAFALLFSFADSGYAQKKESPKQTQPVQNPQPQQDVQLQKSKNAEPAQSSSESSSQQPSSPSSQESQPSNQPSEQQDYGQQNDRQDDSTGRYFQQPMNNPARRPAPVQNLPLGYDRLTHGGNQYYHYNGIFYRRVGDTFRVVRPPLGMRVTQLPPGAVIVYYGDIPYYYYYGVFYLYDPFFEAYVIVEKPSNVIYSDSDETVVVVVSDEELSEAVDFPTPGFDRLVLIDGSSVEGTYLGGTATSIMMQVGGDTLNIAISKIVKIELAAVTDDTSGVAEQESLRDKEIIDEAIFEDSEE